VQQEVDFVEDDYCVKCSGLLFDFTLQCGGVVSGPDLFLGQCLQNLFECFVLGVCCDAVDVAGLDVSGELVDLAVCEMGFPGSSWSFQVDVSAAVLSE